MIESSDSFSVCSVPIKPQHSSSFGQTKSIVIGRSDVTSMLCCPVCLNTISPPIFQCINGHISCSDCLSKVNICPICRIPLNIKARNLQLEQLTRYLIVSCSFSEYGCGDTFLLAEKSSHEINCLYRKFSCPCFGSECSWKGPIYEISKHIQLEHQIICVLKETAIFTIKDVLISDVVCWVMLQKSHHHEFLVRLLRKSLNGSDGQIFVYFQFIIQILSNHQHARQFKFSIFLEKSGTSINYESIPQSFTDETFENNQLDSLNIDLPTIRKFLHDGNLSIRLKIEHNLFSI